MKKVVVLFLLSFSFLFAHKLNVFTTFENNSLFISAYFANGSGCQNCKIKIKKLNGTLIKEAITNKQGEYTTIINEEKFNISVNASAGHIVSKQIIKEKEKTNTTLINDNEKIKTLQEENQRLKSKVKLLEKQLDYFEVFKMIFALLVIFVIFYILKRVKK